MIRQLYTTKALALRETGNTSGELDYYDRVLKIEPNDAVALNNKALLLGKLGNYSKESKYYDKILMLLPNFKS